MSLDGKSKINTYKAVLRLDGTDNQEMSTSAGTAKYIEDGMGQTSALSINSTRVGIGTAEPQQELHVESGDAQIRISDANSSNTTTATASIEYYDRNNTALLGKVGYLSSSNLDMTIYNALAGGVNFSTSATQRMTILSGGNVGIGTASPSEKVEIVSSTASAGLITQGEYPLALTNAETGNTGVTGLAFFPRSNTDYVKSAIIYKGSSVGYNRGDLQFLIDNTADTSNVAVDTDAKMVITRGGNVGIGTTGPTSLLTLGDTSSAISTDTSDGSDNKRLRVGGGGTTDIARGAYINYYGNEYSGYEGNLHLLAGDSNVAGEGHIAFFTATASERMRIDDSGNVGIGTTSPGAKLDVALGLNEIAILNNGTNASGIWGTNIGFLSQASQAQITTAGLPLVFHTGGTRNSMTEGSPRMTIATTGNVGIGTSTPDAPLNIEYTTGAMSAQTHGLIVGGDAGSDTAGHSASIFIGTLQGTTRGCVIAAENEGGDGDNRHNLVFMTSDSSSVPTEAMRIDHDGNVGIGTTNPGQPLDVNSGDGNMIADGYDTHSLAVYKENIEDASGYLDKVLACKAQKWNRKPFVSANEIKEAVLEEFGEDVLIEEAVEAQDAVYETVVVQEAVEEELWAEGGELPEGVEIGDVKTEAQEEETEEQLVSEAIEAKDAVYEKQYSVWDELFPEDNSHRQKALYNMPDGDLKTWIDDWCEAKRVEMRPENKWQKKRLGLVADAELTAEHLPEVVSINDDGEPTGIDTMTYIGILHNAIQELSAKVEALENA